MFSLKRDFEPFQRITGGSPTVAMEHVVKQAKILELGCGRTKRPHAIGIDRIPLPGVDIVHDLNQVPYPFADNTFDEVYAIHVIEHMDSILLVMEEIYRITRPNARVVIITPHHSDAISWQDPSHKWHLNSYSFSYFDPAYHTNYYTTARFRIKTKHLEMASIWKSLGLQYLINLDNRYPALRFLRKLWEQHLCYVLRGKQMEFVLETVKEESAIRQSCVPSGTRRE
jgi:SAM-dependent methyltransferase